MRAANLTPHPETDVLPDLDDEQYEALKEDIEENGIKHALDVLPDGTILDGVHRHRAAQELGLDDDEIPLNELELDADDAEAWIIRANLLRRQLDTKEKYRLYARLSEIFERGQTRDDDGQFQAADADAGDDQDDSPARDATSASPDGDPNADVNERTADAVGESARTVAQARKYARVIEEHPDLDDLPPTTAIKKAKRREEQKERQQAVEQAPDVAGFVNDDAREALQDLPADTAGAMVTDPPYGIDAQISATGMANRALREYGRSEEDSRIRGDRDIEQAVGIFEEVLDAADRVLKDDAHVYVFAKWSTVHYFAAALQRAGWEPKNCLVWKRVDANMLPRFAGRKPTRYGRQYELVLFAARNTDRPVAPDGEKVTDVIEVETPDNDQRKHPHQKPVTLLEQLIANSTTPGELVLDPFAGSASTLIAAEKAGRDWWGAELDDDHYQRAARRLRENNHVSEEPAGHAMAD